MRVVKFRQLLETRLTARRRLFLFALNLRPRDVCGS